MTEEYLETASALCVCGFCCCHCHCLLVCLFLSLGLSQMSSDILKNPHKKISGFFFVFFIFFISFHLFCLLLLLTFLLISPLNGGWRCLMSTPCPESRGSHLIVLSCLFSCSSNCCCCSCCHFYVNGRGPFFSDFLPKHFQYFSLRNGMFCMAVVEYL